MSSTEGRATGLRDERRGRAAAPFERPRLPLAHQELSHFSEHLAEKMMPEMLGFFSDTFGFVTPRMTKRMRRQAVQRAKRGMRNLRGYLLGQSFLAGEIPEAVFRYALLEGLYREQTGLGPRKLRDDQDACFVLLQRLKRTASDPRGRKRLPGYLASRAAVDALALRVARSRDFSAVEKALGGWLEMKEARKVIQLGQSFGGLARRWRWVRPNRPTHTAIAQLVDEYRTMSTAFEILFCKTIGVLKSASGLPIDWRREYRSRLVDLEQWALSPSVPSEMKLLCSGITRDVRNVLAHGHPTTNRAIGKLEFHKHGRCVAQLSIGEFYDHTKRLTATVLAMFQLESQLQLIRYEALLRSLAADAVAAQHAAETKAGSV